MEFLKKPIDDFSLSMYISRPDQIFQDITKYLENLGANPEGIVFEK